MRYIFNLEMIAYLLLQSKLGQSLRNSEMVQVPLARKNKIEKALTSLESEK